MIVLILLNSYYSPIFTTFSYFSAICLLWVIEMIVISFLLKVFQ